MINPGVIPLASLNNIEYMNFPYRFCVEDNIGESIHIHYKDIRLDLTTAQFKEIAKVAEEAINGIVQAEDFSVSDFDPVFLVGISSRLADLQRIEKREVYLEDILVDTFDSEGNPIYANIKHSRIFKALCGLAEENENYKIQFNHFCAGKAEKQSNKERLLWNLAQIKKNGYPVDGNLITITQDNIIQDGQHRAACLYYLYGNIKVPVRTLVFTENINLKEIPSEWKQMEKELWEQAMQQNNTSKVLFQVYFDNNTGFNETDSMKTNYDSNSESLIEINFPVPSGTKKIRIDPADKEGGISIGHLTVFYTDGSTEEIYADKLSNNAIFSFERNYIFCTDDPQLLFETKADKQIDNILIAFLHLSEQSMEKMIAKKEQNLIEAVRSEEKQVFEQERLQLEAALCKTKEAFEKEREELNAVLQSKSWKITQPLRFIAELAKGNHKQKVKTMMRIFFELMKKGFSSLRENGLKITFGKTCSIIGEHFYKEQPVTPPAPQLEPSDKNELFTDYLKYLEEQVKIRFSGKDPNFVDISKTKYERKPNSPKVVAWYLPQYYQMEVNDKFHGRGFTEWTNSSNTIPMFTGHYQPQIPYDVGFYDLTNLNTLKRQATLANIYGVYGFAFHWYWFSGERTMEVPPQLLLEHPEIDIHYCFDWATENWTAVWDGGSNDIIFEQKLLAGDDKKFMDDILPFFRDSRYIKIDGKPVLSIYRCDMFEKKQFIDFLRDIRARAKKEGFPDLYLMLTNRVEGFDIEGWGFDALAEFPPCCVYPLSNMNPPMEIYKNPNLKADFFDVQNFIKEKKFLTSYKYSKYYRSALVGFDNSPRRATTGCQIILNNTPEAFKEWMKTLFIESKAIHSQEENIVFVNSWNEWAEGSHLEPDLKYGYAYLQAVKDALEESDSLHTDIISKQVEENTKKGIKNHFFVFCIESMGDIVASEPISRHLKCLDSSGKVTWIVKPQYSQLLQFNPNIDEIKEVECLHEGEELCNKLRQDQGTIIVDTHFDGRWCSKTKIQHKNTNNTIVNEKTYFYFKSLLGSFCLSAGLPIINDAPRFYFDPSKKAPADLPKKYIVIHCLSAESTKDWEKEKWNSLVKKIIHLGYTVVEVGMEHLVGISNTMYIDKTEEHDLQIIARIIEKAQCFIGIDSGFAHFANAIGIPGVMIFGRYKNFDYPMSYTGNYANGILSEIVYAKHDFAKTISVERVFDAFKRVTSVIEAKL